MAQPQDPTEPSGCVIWIPEAPIRAAMYLSRLDAKPGQDEELILAWIYQHYFPSSIKRKDNNKGGAHLGYTTKDLQEFGLMVDHAPSLFVTMIAVEVWYPKAVRIVGFDEVRFGLLRGNFSEAADNRWGKVDPWDKVDPWRTDDLNKIYATCPGVPKLVEPLTIEKVKNDECPYLNPTELSHRKDIWIKSSTIGTATEPPPFKLSYIIDGEYEFTCKIGQGTEEGENPW
ncbi:hypothetical protein MMC26_002609 [Xylographa opegraphella]|nr:hypothetical protein [Xylographa opegraphella]